MAETVAARSQTWTVQTHEDAGGQADLLTNRLLYHLRTHILRGTLAIIPVALSALAVYLLYTIIDRRVATAIAEVIHRRIPGLGLLLVVVLLYLLGLVASNLVGREFLRLIEKGFDRIPLIRTTYQVGKQISAALSLPQRQVFTRSVLVEYLRPGMWTIGFVTGILDTSGGERILKIFIPTPPNPTTGTIVLVRESEVRDTGWTVDEAMRTIISAGIIGPTHILPWSIEPGPGLTRDVRDR